MWGCSSRAINAASASKRRANSAPPARSGRVTSSALSPTLGHAIGLAYVPPDLAGEGWRFEIRVEAGRMVEATVVPLPFYDPDNARQEA